MFQKNFVVSWKTLSVILQYIDINFLKIVSISHLKCLFILYISNNNSTSHPYTIQKKESKISEPTQTGGTETLQRNETQQSFPCGSSFDRKIPSHNASGAWQPRCKPDIEEDADLAGPFLQVDVWDVLEMHANIQRQDQQENNEP